ncbi:membrane protein [Kitasatospora indigofera]|uniref:Membrane protein n=1 Tax=Kitasatospora indigofera TaxID=67307 RepID=A0A919G5L6_9ACTN|nr:glutaredoxin domain-containing protein [Kitasatospora indigofera]GHH78109.1 membrane protein [Kitasatospora indigofera]
MVRAWILPLSLLALGSLVAALLAVQEAHVAAAALLSAFVLLAGLHSPLAFPRPVGAAEAERRSAVDGRPVVYWRAGCKYCLRLRFRLGRDARRVHWVDIWRDPAGAAVVRMANGGDETVPTVVVAGRAHVNPDPAWVRGQLGSSG